MVDKKHVTASLRYFMLCNLDVITTTLEWQQARQKVDFISTLIHLTINNRWYFTETTISLRPTSSINVHKSPKQANYGIVDQQDAKIQLIQEASTINKPISVRVGTRTQRAVKMCFYDLILLILGAHYYYAIHIYSYYVLNLA